MNREGVSLFSSLFGSKGSGSEPGTSESGDVTTTSFAQPHVLREKMKEKQLSHGETVTVNMSPVRLEGGFSKMHLYFCPLETIQILEKVSPGDGGEIPETVVVEGLSAPAGRKAGLYSLKNVRLSSNGAMQVIADEKTIWEEV